MSNNTRRKSDTSRAMNNNTFIDRYGSTIIQAIKKFNNTTDKEENTEADLAAWNSTYHDFKTALSTGQTQKSQIGNVGVMVGFNESYNAFVDIARSPPLVRKASNMPPRTISIAGLGDNETSTNSPLDSPVQPRRTSGQRGVLQLQGPLPGSGTETDPTPRRRGAVKQQLHTLSQLRAKRPPPPVPGSRPVPTRKAPNRPLSARPVTSASEYVPYNPHNIFSPEYKAGDCGAYTKKQKNNLRKQYGTMGLNNQTKMCINKLMHNNKLNLSNSQKELVQEYDSIRNELDREHYDDSYKCAKLPKLTEAQIVDAETNIRAEYMKPGSILGYFLKKKDSKYREVVKAFVIQYYKSYETRIIPIVTYKFRFLGTDIYEFTKTGNTVTINHLIGLDLFIKTKHIKCKANKSRCKPRFTNLNYYKSCSSQ